MNTILSLPGLHWLAHKQPFSSRLKQAAFNAKHRAGQWGNGESPELGRCVDRYTPAGGTVQILGCGAADLCGVMDMSKPRFVWGNDVSQVALDCAKERYYHKFRNLELVHGDMRNRFWSYCDISVFPESLYYLNKSDQLDLLHDVGGVRIVTIWDPVKYASIPEMIRTHFHIIEEFNINRRLVLVF